MDLEITGLRAIIDASDVGATATIQMIDRWIDEATRFQSWFESHATELVELLKKPGEI
ncbi:hypothetical protein [Anatilimnocola floriformis]|uniref:hypothetical protein n=1 Tax=Anatilimnocola floriformis TaxID=2948575 RepID=UPI0020C2E8CE|nr:hypothetical protein [Anatilimnocola floriformis]